METAVKKHAVLKLRGTMVKIPSGSFLMGAENMGEFESPVHEVWLDEFCIDVTSVTNVMFHDFVKQTQYVTTVEVVGVAWGYQEGEFKMIEGLSWRSYFNDSRENHPVVMVSWVDAKAFAKWAGKRLPSEAEWEKASRGGLVQKLYPWGDHQPDGYQCNFAKEPSNIPGTTEVKAFPPNKFGIYDMVGNVWQWCEDWFSEDYFPLAAADNPSGPTSESLKVRRGGSWNVIQPFRLRCANRGAFEANACAPNIGFRCAI